MKLIALVLTTVVVQLALTTSALAGPPATGSARPASIIPKPIAFGFVGAAVVGPVSSCAKTTTASGGTATLCSDVALLYAELYRRGTGTAWKRTYLQNGSDRVLFTAPYAKGWQWVWTPNIGYGVMKAHDLFEFAPTS
jgi:hypothetical protein